MNSETSSLKAGFIFHPSPFTLHLSSFHPLQMVLPWPITGPIFPFEKLIPILGTFINFTIQSVRIISKRTLREFWQINPSTEQSLKSWHKEVSLADWKSPTDVRADFTSASILQAGRVVFNIQGNRYRLIVRINYEFGIVWVRFVGTHADYDRIDANKIWNDKTHPY